MEALHHQRWHVIGAAMPCRMQVVCLIDLAYGDIRMISAAVQVLRIYLLIIIFFFLFCGNINFHCQCDKNGENRSNGQRFGREIRKRKKR